MDVAAQVAGLGDEHGFAGVQIALDRTLDLDHLRRDARLDLAFLAHSHALRVMNRAFHAALDQQVDENEAVKTALQAFEDGIYLVLVDGIEQRSLDAVVPVSSESRVLFLRLSLLAGG